MTYIPIDRSETAHWNKDAGAALQRGGITKTNFTLESWRKAGGKGSMKRRSLIPSDPQGGVVDGVGGPQPPLSLLGSDLSAAAGINFPAGKFGHIYIFQFI